MSSRQASSSTTGLDVGLGLGPIGHPAPIARPTTSVSTTATTDSSSSSKDDSVPGVVASSLSGGIASSSSSPLSENQKLKEKGKVFLGSKALVDDSDEVVVTPSISSGWRGTGSGGWVAVPIGVPGGAPGAQIPPPPQQQPIVTPVGGWTRQQAQNQPQVWGAEWVTGPGGGL